jgi:hypothetical protein
MGRDRVDRRGREDEFAALARKLVDEATVVPETQRLTFDSSVGVFRALQMGDLFRRPDLGLWGALVLGRDADFRLRRRFLPRAGASCVDLAMARVGSVLELAGYVAEGKERRRYARVLRVDPEGVTLAWLPDAEAAVRAVTP